jgi:hypothetical protein
MSAQEPGDARSWPSFPTLPTIIFAHWREVLNASGLADRVRSGYGLAITGYLDYCRHNGLSVTFESARAYLADAERRRLARNPELWRDALRWFFREGKRTSGLQPEGVPSLGQADTGRTAWERRLIERLRLNHYSWRTEQTYREWAWRLHQFMGSQGVEEATTEDVKAFLTRLAVQGRVSVATQQQALNALVFLFREGLAREIGDLTGFEVSRRGPRVPTVLTRAECDRLFAKLDGTAKLMAQLMPKSTPT